MTLTTTARPAYPHPLPSWVVELRPYQPPAVQAIVEAFREVDLVILDAPVGSGKTLIAELVRRELGARHSLYICSDKGLQDQVERDFPYAAVLKGRVNYPTELRDDLTCEDCTAEADAGRVTNCFWCSDRKSCPYQIAKARALNASLAVTNTAMFLTSANYAGFLNENDLVIADECDLIEDALLRFVAYEVPRWAIEATGMRTPKKASRKHTLVKWLEEFAGELRSWRETQVLGETLDPRRKRAVDSLIASTIKVATLLRADMEDQGGEEDVGYWFRDYDTGTFKLRPVTVSAYGERYLWRHGQKWLLMSGTVVSAQELMESLGWEQDYRVVSVPSTFPVENRPINLAPVANVIRAKGEDEWDRLAYAIEQICLRHEGRVLVHTVSYALTQGLARRCRPMLPEARRRRVFSHLDSRSKNAAIKAWLDHENAVMFSPSMMRGVDLANDACRVQIIAKCPFPSLGDKQVSLRLHLPGGQLWYSVRTIRDIVQMTGRAVRSEDDWAVTYILDQQFVRNVWSRYRSLFLPSFTEVVRGNQDLRWLMAEYNHERNQ